MKNEELPTGLYRRKDSPYIWYKFKLVDMAKAVTGSTETDDIKLAKLKYDSVRGNAIQGKINPQKDNISLEVLCNTALNAFRKNPSYQNRCMLVRSLLKSPMLKGKRAKNILPADLEEYQSVRSEQVSISTVNRELGALKATYNYGIHKLKLTLTNPVCGIQFFDEKPRARDRHLLDDEKKVLFNDKGLNERIRDLYLFAIMTGLRQGELIEALWPHIDWNKHTLKVKTLKKKRKGGTSEVIRYVPLNEDCMGILNKQRLQGWPIKSHFIFCDLKGEKRSKWGEIITALKWGCRRNKILNFRYHDLRHTFGSDFTLATNGDFKSLAEIMGHSREAMSERYAHLLPAHKSSQIAKLPRASTFLQSNVNATDEKWNSNR